MRTDPMWRQVWFRRIEFVEKGFKDAAENTNGVRFVDDESRRRLCDKPIAKAVFRNTICLRLHVSLFKLGDIPP